MSFDQPDHRTRKDPEWAQVQNFQIFGNRMDGGVPINFREKGEFTGGLKQTKADDPGGRIDRDGFFQKIA